MATVVTLTPAEGSEITLNLDDEMLITGITGGTIITSGGLSVFVQQTPAQIEDLRRRSKLN